MTKNQDQMDFVYDLDVSEDDNFARFMRYCIAHRELQTLFLGGDLPPLELESMRYLFNKLKDHFPKRSNRIIH